MKWHQWALQDTPRSPLQAQLSRSYRLFIKLLKNPLSCLGLIIIALLLFAALFAPLLVFENPNIQNLSHRLSPPSFNHWMGTDALGRDIYSRIIYGARITLTIVCLVSLITAPLGVLLGVIAGYCWGWVDRLIMAMTDIFLSMPKLVLALAFVAALGPGLENAVIAIALTSWPAYTRIARAEVLTFKNSEFIHAAQLMGAPPLRIILHHILPLCVPSMIIRVTLDMAGIILTAAALGFLGLGAQPPLAEWGAMIANGRNFITNEWWLATMPGLAIVTVSMGFCFLGDGLRDILDPKQEGQI